MNLYFLVVFVFRGGVCKGVIDVIVGVVDGMITVASLELVVCVGAGGSNVKSGSGCVFGTVCVSFCEVRGGMYVDEAVVVRDLFGFDDEDE